MNDESVLRLKINGQPGEIHLKALEKSIAAISKIICAVGGRQADQFVKELHTSSAVIDVVADRENVAAVDKGLLQLRDDKSLGFEFNRSALTAVRELCDLASMDGVTGIEFGALGSPVNMDSRIAENASKALASVRLSLGSVRGKLYKFNGRTLPYKGGIEDYRTGKAVQLEIDVEHVNDVLQLMQQEVRVWGILSRDPITNEVVSVKVKGVDAITAKKRLPRPAIEVQGILGAEWLDGMQPDEFVRRERGA